jgi:hypothetical protein
MTSAIDPEILKLVGLAGMFATVSVAAYILFKSHAERVSVRAGLESALSNPALSDDRSLVLRVPFMRRILRPASGRLARVVYRLGPEGIAQAPRSGSCLRACPIATTPTPFSH